MADTRVPSVQSVSDIGRLMRLQTETMTQSPDTLVELTRAIGGLAETFETCPEHCRRTSTPV